MNDLAYDPGWAGAGGPATGGGRRRRRLVGTARQAAGLGLSIAAVVAAVDLASYGVNLSIAYSLPMALYARSCRRPAGLWRVAAVLVFLAYAGYFLGPRDPATPTFVRQMFHYRVVNRTVSAASILAIAGMSHAGIALRRRFRGRWEPRDAGRESDRELFAEVVNSFEQFQAAAMSAMAVAAVAAVDLVIPAQFNPSILYAVPVLGCARARRRPVLWLVAGACMALTLAGFYLAPRPDVDPAILPRLLRNRRLTEVMILTMALFVHVWIGVDNPGADRRPRPGDDDGAARPTRQEERA